MDVVVAAVVLVIVVVSPLLMMQWRLTISRAQASPWSKQRSYPEASRSQVHEIFGLPRGVRLNWTYEAMYVVELSTVFKASAQDRKAVNLTHTHTHMQRLAQQGLKPGFITAEANL